MVRMATTWYPVLSMSHENSVSGVDAVMKQSSAQTYWVRRVIAFVIDAFIVYFVVGVVCVPVYIVVQVLNL